MRCLGIDHASRSGWAVLDDDKLIERGCIYVTGNTIPERLGKLYNSVSKLIEKYKPDMIAVEQPKHRLNGNTTLLLISYYTLIMYCAYEHNVKVNEVNPMQMKKLVTGDGHADKDKVLQYIAMRLGVSIDDISPVDLYKVGKNKGQMKCRYYDESDACALAYFTWLKCRKETYNG
jgi:crossover junction endodeoxyribonuclease RuvC